MSFFLDFLQSFNDAAPWTHKVGCPTSMGETPAPGVRLSMIFLFLLSAFLWNCFLCQDHLSGDVPLWLGSALFIALGGALIQGLGNQL